MKGLLDRRNRRHKRSLAMIALALPMGLAACGSEDGQTAGGGSGGGGTQTVKIGDLESLTGAAASVGVPQACAMEVAAKRINDEGGIKAGGTTYTIDLVTEDDKSDPTAGVTAVQKLLSEGINYMVGSTSSSVTSAYVPVIESRADFVSVVVSAAVSGITDKEQIYRPRITNEQYTDATVKYLAEQGELKRIAMLTDKVHAGFVAETPRLRKLLGERGVQTVANESYQFGDTDFGGQISAMLRGKPDVLNVRGYPADVTRAIKQARDQGFDGPIITNSGTTPDEVEDAQAAPAMKDVTDIFMPLPSDQIALDINVEASQRFLDEFDAGCEEEPAGTSASAYDGLRILAAAIGKAGGPDDVAAVRKALDELTMDEVPGLVTAFVPQEGDKLFRERQSYFTAVARAWDPETSEWEPSEAI